MEKGKLDFHLEEYKQIRAEVVGALTRAEQLMKYGVVIAAAVFAWLATQSLGLGDNGKLCTKLPIDGPLGVRIWCVPALAVIVIGLLGGAIYLRVKEMGEYLKILENALGQSTLGWEKFLSTKKATVSIVSGLAWLVLLVATSYVALQMQHEVPTYMPCPATKP